MRVRQLLIVVLLTTITCKANAQGVSFISDAETGCAPLTVQFTNTSTVGTTFKWEIRDGASQLLYTEYGTNMTYSFTYPLYFHIYLSAYDSSENLLGIGSGTVFIPGDYTIQAYSDTVCPGDEIYFSCQGSADALLWQFGDGNSANGLNSYQQVSHSFSAIGEYYPRVIVVNMCSRDTLTFSNPVIVTNSLPAHIPTLNVSSNKICPGATVHFSTYPAQGFTSLLEWDFGDGNTMVTQDLEVNHQYSSLGSYSATLTRSNNCGNENSYSHNILVSDTLAPSVPAINFHEINPCNNSEIMFETYGNNYDIQSFYWDFGDAVTDATATPVHVYASPGMYTVTLTITNFCGNSGSTSAPITIDNTNQTFNAASFLIFPDVACAGDTIYMGDFPYTFTPTDSSTSVHWDFGDGNSATGINTSHIYTNPGTYHVTRTLTNVCGNSASITDTVLISNSVIPPVTVFPISPAEACPGDVVCFGDLNPMGNSNFYDNDFYIWNYDDGLIDTTHSLFTRHSFTGSGNYLVTLTTVNKCGNQSSFSEIVEISNDLEVPEFSWYCREEPPSGNLHACKNIFFTATSNEGYTYEWDFGDGNVLITDSNTTSHVFTKEDIYAVAVTAVNGCGNSKTSLRHIVITGLCTIVDEIVMPPGILAYPNPVSEQLNISYKGFYYADLFSVDGQKVLTVTPQKYQSASMNVSQIPDGIYFLKIICGENSLTQKVIVIH